MLLILVPWMQISKAVASDVVVSVPSLLAVLAAGIIIHLLFLAFNLTATSALRLGKSSSDGGKHVTLCLLLSSCAGQKSFNFLQHVVHVCHFICYMCAWLCLLVQHVAQIIQSAASSCLSQVLHLDESQSGALSWP